MVTDGERAAIRGAAGQAKAIEQRLGALVVLLRVTEQGAPSPSRDRAAEAFAAAACALEDVAAAEVAPATNAGTRRRRRVAWTRYRACETEVERVMAEDEVRAAERRGRA